MLRPARLADLAALPEIERAAGEMFRPIGMAFVADDELPSAAELRPYVDAGRAWVVDVGGELAGYLITELVDGCAHLEQVSVDPRFGRRGLGAALIEHLAQWASGQGLPAITLTTYRDVPWNGPYYAARGFRWLREDELTPGLRAIRQHEIDRGLDQWPRGCMRRELA